MTAFLRYTCEVPPWNLGKILTATTKDDICHFRRQQIRHFYFQVTKCTSRHKCPGRSQVKDNTTARRLSTPFTFILKAGLYIRKHEMLNQCWAIVGLSSTTLVQHQPSIGSASRVCWVCRKIAIYRYLTGCSESIIDWDLHSIANCNFWSTCMTSWIMADVSKRILQSTEGEMAEGVVRRPLVCWDDTSNLVLHKSWFLLTRWRSGLSPTGIWIGLKTYLPIIPLTSGGMFRVRAQGEDYDDSSASPVSHISPMM